MCECGKVYVSDCVNILPHSCPAATCVWEDKQQVARVIRNAAEMFTDDKYMAQCLLFEMVAMATHMIVLTLAFLHAQINI